MVISGAKHGIDKSVLEEFKGQVIDKVDLKLKNFPTKDLQKVIISYAFGQNHPLNTLNDFHYQFAVTPIGKINANVAFIC